MAGMDELWAELEGYEHQANELANRLLSEMDQEEDLWASRLWSDIVDQAKALLANTTDRSSPDAALANSILWFHLRVMNKKRVKK